MELLNGMHAVYVRETTVHVQDVMAYRLVERCMINAVFVEVLVTLVVGQEENVTTMEFVTAKHMNVFVIWAGRDAIAHVNKVYVNYKTVENMVDVIRNLEIVFVRTDTLVIFAISRFALPMDYTIHWLAIASVLKATLAPNVMYVLLIR